MRTSLGKHAPRKSNNKFMEFKELGSRLSSPRPRRKSIPRAKQTLENMKAKGQM